MPASDASISKPTLIFLNPQNFQKNQSGQYFWPNLFLGRWLKRVSAPRPYGKLFIRPIGLNRWRGRG